MQKHLKPKDATFHDFAYPDGILTLAVVKTETRVRGGIAVIQNKDLEKRDVKLGNDIAFGRATLRRPSVPGQYDLSGVDTSNLKRVLNEAKRQEKNLYGRTIKYKALLGASKSL
mgnify:CR=1 FL=1